VVAWTLASRRQEIGLSKTGSVKGNEEPGLMGWSGAGDSEWWPGLWQVDGTRSKQN